jgi:hypothetical protein
MSQIFQIHEDDLQELESTLPKLADQLFESMDNRTRVQLRRVQKIISDVRWNYGPPSEIHSIPADEPNS